MITRQKLHAILKKAGHTRSEFHRSSMVRGYGSNSRGYHISDHRTSWVIEIRGYLAREHDEREIKRIAKSLDEASIPYKLAERETIQILKDSNP